MFFFLLLDTFCQSFINNQQNHINHSEHPSTSGVLFKFKWFYLFFLRICIIGSFSIETKLEVTTVGLPPLTANQNLRLYLQTNSGARLYPPRPFQFLSRGCNVPLSLGPPHSHPGPGHRLPHHHFLPSWPGFPLSGRKRRHRTIFTEGQLREVIVY